MQSNGYKLFLTAQWRWLAMLNYEIDPAILAPFVPAGTELDFWNGKTYVSIVGFLFQNTRVRGFSIPFHRNFEEVNLRFYVRCKAEDGWRRGVVFIKELVPRAAIAFIAKTFYNENYVQLPMSHQISGSNDKPRFATGHPIGLSAAVSVRYSWRYKNSDNFLSVTTRGTAQRVPEGSQQEFITEHYWGYVIQRDRSTKEYRVEHPRWQIWETEAAQFHCDIANLYGKQFSESLSRQPSSSFLADGSEVKLYNGMKLEPCA
jgi:hypothetical protein